MHAAEVLESCDVITAKHARALLPLLPFEPFGTGQAFFSGVRSDVGEAVLQPSMRHLPNACMLLAKFVKQTNSSFRFNSIAIFCDVCTSPHRDALNGSRENLISPLSSFSKGEIWVQDPQKSSVELINRTPVNGSLLDVSAGPVLLQAKDKVHFTKPWFGGSRMVVVAFALPRCPSFSHQNFNATRILRP